MAEQLITYGLEGAVAVIGLNRADKRNAINDAVMTQLREAVFRANEEAKAGVIFGHGENFSAGLDLAEATTWMKPGAPRRKRGRWNRSLDLVARGQIPIVAALKGACIGGGLELAAAAQVRVADETTFFALPEGQRGIFVGGGGSVRIQRLMGYARMADLMLTGRVLTAEEGERANLCQYVVPQGEVARAREVARGPHRSERAAHQLGCVLMPAARQRHVARRWPVHRRPDRQRCRKHRRLRAGQAFRRKARQAAGQARHVGGWTVS